MILSLSFVVMKRILIILLFVSTAAFGQKQIRLSDQARISVITCGPGQEELYSAFGHSAFRVYDPSQRIDLAYNYGIFDFDQPHFYLNFAKGFLYYKLGVHDYRDFEYHYLSHGRYVHEQVLDLTSEQTQKVFEFLEWNAMPENANYRYDYFFDNCATKMPDVISKVLKEEVTFSPDHITTNYTIRDLTDLYIRKQQPWGDLGIDICLGLPMDKKATPYEYMFLPDYVEAGFAHATIKHDSIVVPLVKATIKAGNETSESQAFFIRPVDCFTAFALIAAALSFYDFRKQKATKWFDMIWLIVTGLIGILLTFLWFFTDHAAAAKNFNLLWAIPLNLVAGIALWKNPKWLKQYFLVLMIVEIATLLGYKFIPQELHFALIPLMIAFALRSFVLYRLRPQP